VPVPHRERGAGEGGRIVRKAHGGAEASARRPAAPPGAHDRAPGGREDDSRAHPRRAEERRAGEQLRRVRLRRGPRLLPRRGGDPRGARHGRPPHRRGPRVRLGCLHRHDDRLQRGSSQPPAGRAVQPNPPQPRARCPRPGPGAGVRLHAPLRRGRARDGAAPRGGAGARARPLHRPEGVGGERLGLGGARRRLVAPLPLDGPLVRALGRQLRRGKQRPGRPLPHRRRLPHIRLPPPLGPDQDWREVISGFYSAIREAHGEK